MKEPHPGLWILISEILDLKFIFRRERALAGDVSVSKGTLVAVKVIDRMTAPATFLKKFLPRELEVVKQVGMAL